MECRIYLLTLLLVTIGGLSCDEDPTVDILICPSDPEDPGYDDRICVEARDAGTSSQKSE